MPWDDNRDHLLGLLIVQGGHLAAHHPGPGEVDRPGAERRDQFGEPLQVPGQLQQRHRRSPGEAESGPDLVGGELAVVVGDQGTRLAEASATRATRPSNPAW